MSQSDGQSRADRTSSRRTRNGGLIVVGIIVAVIVGVGIALFASGAVRTGGDDEDTAVSGPPANLTLFAVQGDPSYAAVVGTANGREPEVLAVPPNVLTSLPEVGSGTISNALRASGASGRMAVANMLGAWIPRYVIVDEAGLAQMVDRRGGIEVNLPPNVRVGERVLGPGPTKLTGADVLAYLNVRQGGEQRFRWQEVLGGLFAGRVPLDEGSVVETDEMIGALKAMSIAGGAEVHTLPTEVVGGGFEEVDNEEIRRTLRDVFGIDAPIPTPVIVMDGISPCPDCGEMVTNLLVPAGYRAVAFADIRGQRHKTTLVVPDARELIPSSEQIVKALGVGSVAVSRTDSGLADITVIVGADFLEKMGISVSLPTPVVDTDASPTPRRETEDAAA